MFAEKIIRENFGNKVRGFYTNSNGTLMVEHTNMPFAALTSEPAIDLAKRILAYKKRILKGQVW